MATEYVKTIECPKCRYKNVAGTKFCGDCGTALAGSPVPCGKCGIENPSGTKFCGNCGNNIENPTENDPDIRHLQDALRGKYVVQKALGEGGFGRVFLAEHIGLKQKHVIKVLSADSSRSTDIRSRFFQEAQVIAKLKHPHIVPIMDVAEHGGRPYYIMSYINGGSLADLLRLELKLSSERAIELTIKLLSALSEVHGKGIIHRDIKPDNVLLDESGEPFLIDFGIARVEEGGKAKTGTGFSIGTPQYMSPEQLDAKPINLTTDIYSMGIMLFELLTGKPPFEGSLSSLVTQHNTSKLPSVSGKIENSKLADGIQAVLQKACAKEPSARYGSAKDMRGAVEGLIEKPKYSTSVVEPAKVFTNSLGIKFQYIPAGEFMMGAVPQYKEADDDEKPQHKVRITKPFYMGKYPVTQEEWEKLMGNNPSEFKKAGKRAPVETVSWNDCQEFIKKLNQKEGKTYRLPTEAEWEYSARGGVSGGSTIYTYGDDVSKLDDYAWYDGNSGNTTHPVGQKKPNSLGLYDMMGNVREWCGDWYDDEYYKNSPNADPKGADKGEFRVLRGGSWNINARNCRLSLRGNDYPDSRYYNNGFRLVLLP